jgi:hypothetical protein
MTTAVANRPTGGLLSAQRLSLLARTCDGAPQPIWIDDPHGNCLYHNSRAAGHPDAGRTAAFDLVDHKGRLLGRLRTLPA